jgi:transposase
VVIDLTVRRLFCESPACPRRTFAEQVEGLTLRYGRYTPTLLRMLQAVGLALAGRAGARLLAVMHVVVSWATLLNLVMALPEPSIVCPQVLGVDDFALRRGHVYATILIDVETGERIDVLPDRTSGTFAAWLLEHPGAQIVCRDRASAYADAVRTAAPGALQVADRFHLWKNLCEAAEECVRGHRGCLPEPQEPSGPPPGAPGGPEPRPETPVPPPGRRATQCGERHAAVHQLFDKGVGVYAIATALHLDPKTVSKYAHAPRPQDVPTSDGQRDTAIRPFLDYLHHRWNEGCTDGARLHAEISKLGFRGSTRTVRRHLQFLRSSSRTAPTRPTAPTVRETTRLITSHPTSLKDEESLQLKGILSRCPELNAVTDCVRSFAEMMTTRSGSADLTEWLARAEATQQPPLRSLVNGLRQDITAVTAGLTLEWSSGKVEGNVNRIKMIKRKMFGRAGFKLLRRQILLS